MQRVAIWLILGGNFSDVIDGFLSIALEFTYGTSRESIQNYSKL